jgi:hypothetical protein
MAYLAPEAWLRETSTIQRDMYAVGLVMFEMATLEYALPLPAERNRERWRETHLYGRVKRLSDSRSDLPAGVEQVLLRLTAKRPQDRFGSWADVRAALATAWKPSDVADANRAAMDRVVRVVTEVRASREQAAAAAAKDAEASADVARAASYQWTQLLDEIETALADLVKLGTIAVKRQHEQLTVTVDGLYLSLEPQGERSFLGKAWHPSRSPLSATTLKWCGELGDRLTIEREKGFEPYQRKPR